LNPRVQPSKPRAEGSDLRRFPGASSTADPPYLNAALRRLDERLASAEDMDRRCASALAIRRPDLVARTNRPRETMTLRWRSIAHWAGAYAPARRAQVAKARRVVEMTPVVIVSDVPVRVPKPNNRAKAI